MGRWIYVDGQISIYDRDGVFRWYTPDDRLVGEGKYKIIGLSGLRMHSDYLWDVSNPLSLRQETGPGSGVDEAISESKSGLFLSWDGNHLYTPSVNPAFGVDGVKSMYPGRRLGDNERLGAK